MKNSKFLNHYAIAALWSSTDEGGEPLDLNYRVTDIAPETILAMRADCADFLFVNRRLIRASGQSIEQTAHDFWLTHNRHGAGFWDRCLGVIGEQLSEAAQSYGGIDLYAGDDGKVHA